MWFTDRTEGRSFGLAGREFGCSRRHASVRGQRTENHGYESRGSAHLPRRLRHWDCVSCAGSVQVELLRSLSCFPVDLLQCCMDRVLDCLDGSFGGADTFDGRNLWLDCSALDADFHPRRIWNLDLPDVPGLPAKAF